MPHIELRLKQVNFKARLHDLKNLLLFLVLSVTRPRRPLGQILIGTLDHATCNVYSPKAFETIIHENVTHIVYFLLRLKYLFFWFYRGVRFEGKDLKWQSTSYLESIIQDYHPSITLRSSPRSLLCIPSINSNSYGGRAFSAAAPEL